MSKHKRAILALVLAVLLLAGCAGESAVQAIGRAAPKGHREDSAVWLAQAGRDPREELDPVPFDQMEYARPQLDRLRREVEEAEQVLAAGTDRQAAQTLFQAALTDYVQFDTMGCLALIRSRQDITDSAMAEEYAWCQAQAGEVTQLIGRLYDALDASPLEGLSAPYSFQEPESPEEDGAAVRLSDEAVRLLASESALENEYRGLAAQLDAEKESVWSGDWAQVYARYNGELARVYLQLADVRQDLARELGYAGYEQMAYAYLFGRDYSPEQAGAYTGDIRAYMTPLFRQLWEQDPFGGVDFSPLDSQRLHDLLGGAAQELGGQLQSAYDYMDRYGLYDVRCDAGKAAGSFQVYLPAYEAPFIFLDAAGNLQDLLSYSHEFGHFVDSYVNFSAYASLDLSECFSQCMEFLALFYCEDSLTDQEVEALWRIQLPDTVRLYVEQAVYAEFEHAVYAQENPEQLDAGYLNSLCLELMEDFGLDAADGDSLYNSMCWMGISHLFESPFYVISYPVSMDCAMQLLALELEEPGLGAEKYRELLPRRFEGLLDSLDACGLESPFAPGRVQAAAELLEDLLALLPEQ